MSPGLTLRAGHWERMPRPETIVRDQLLHPPTRLFSNFAGCYYLAPSHHRELQSS